jgi:exodeoxyribonuclease VIII
MSPTGNAAAVVASGFETYRAIRGVNWSTLRDMRASPLHYKQAVDMPREDSDTLALGRAVHTAVLEPDRFPIDYTVWQGARRAGKEWEAFCAANQAQTILKVDQYATCLAIRDAVRRDPIAAAYLASGEAERNITWTDAETGLACKGRLDWHSPARKALVDLKTTRSVDARMFGATAFRFGYHCQLAYYLDGWRASVPGDPMEAVIIAVESEPPHDVGVFLLDDEVLYAGREEYHELLARVKGCMLTGRWPGRYDEPQLLQLPSWAFPNDDDEAAHALLGKGGQ